MGSTGDAYETYLVARPWRLPAFMRVTYRLEAFATTGQDPFPERISMLGVGIGVAFGNMWNGRRPAGPAPSPAR